MSGGLDPRLNAVRADLADIALRGRAEAARFVHGQRLRVSAPVAPVRKAPAADAMLLTEALRGEAATVFEFRDGWAWAQLAEDRYVGWMPADALADGAPEPTHRIAALRTLLFPAPDIKAPPLAGLPFGAKVAVTGEAEDRNARYGMVAPEGAVVRQHLAAAESAESDWTAVAERFLGVPYLWGGKTSLGLDCSGLVQVALRACGVPAPRDTDMQEAALGAPLAAEAKPRRGDVVFWKGHVGLMADGETLLHANAHHMAVVLEPLAEAVARNGARGVPVTSIRRIA